MTLATVIQLFVSRDWKSEYGVLIVLRILVEGVNVMTNTLFFAKHFDPCDFKFLQNYICSTKVPLKDPRF